MGKYLNQNRMCVPHRQMYTRIQENRNLKKFEWSKHTSLISLDKEIWFLGISCIRKLSVEADWGDFPDETITDAKYKLQ